MFGLPRDGIVLLTVNSFPLKVLVPFDGDGHWHLCLDYRQNATTPSVTYVDIETDHESQIATSFAAYLAMLRIDAADQFVLEAVSDIETVKSTLSSLLATDFDPPDTWASGYPIHRARLGTKNKPEWIWISPNMVPRGFVRPDEPRYAQLKDLLPGTKRRFPELPADSYLLKATAGVRSKVLDACTQTGMIVRRLAEFL